MRIHQIPLGTRFEYAGQEYVKTGPLIGTSSAGARLIPKHAVLKPLGNVALPPVAEPAETLPRARVLRAFEAFYAQCGPLVPAVQQRALKAARESFLKALGD